MNRQDTVKAIPLTAITICLWKMKKLSTMVFYGIIADSERRHFLNTNSKYNVLFEIISGLPFIVNLAINGKRMNEWNDNLFM